ncbi:MAG TPA: carboxypeptidase regulatory-like domain-containing protein [Cryomorphaceae bacterium]|nr:carboxypeptidase regulatory-like domain-containing protein [Cryomorphaceae bacterium]
MLRNLYLLGLVFLFSSISVYAQVGSGTLKGTLTDAETGEPLPFVNLVLLKGDRQVAGGSTNFDGEYTIKPIPPGSYNVAISFVGYNAKRINGVEINNSKITFLDVELESGVKLEEFEVIEYEVPLIDKDGGSTGGTVTREDISKMPGRSATSIAATVGGVQETGGGISLRGARTENTFYYIDGIKVRGSNNLPKAAIEEVQVLTGGIPANYGDATGGIISITTRGASSEYFGSLDVITSGFADEDGNGIGLDRYAQTQIEGVISGPLLWKKDAEGNKTDPLLGFFVSGNYRNSLDNRPTIGQYRIKESTRQQLISNPIDYQFSGVEVSPSGDQYIDENGDPQNSTIVVPNVQGNPNAEFLRADDWEEVPARQNDRLQGVSLTGKLDVATGPNLDLSFGGTFDWVQDNIYSYSNSLFNAPNNGRSTDQTWRAFGRFTQRFSDGDAQESDGLIKNAYYSVMVDYSQRRFEQQDPTHQDRLFNYGYVGSFETIETPNYTFDGDSLNAFVHSGFRTLETTFTPSETNPDLAAYTSGLYDFYDELGFTVRTGNDIDAANGIRNGRLPDDVYNLYRPLGRPFNSYQLFDQDQFRITASGNADVGDHAITIGFEFEQFTQRSFSVSPVGLWNQARQLTNSHIEELDFESTPSIQTIGTATYYTYDRLIDLGSQSTFDRNLRNKLGLNPNGDDYIYVDALDPDLFELEMFSADELLRQGNNALVGYYGYDYQGNRLSGGSPTIEDFFNATDEQGNNTRPVGAFNPIYASFYVMDKFAFDDIIFNVGLRVDRFDANQPTLKDQFVIGEAVTVGDARNLVGSGGDNSYLANQPSVVQDDWVIYVNDLQNPTAINGYREGNTWFNAQGVEIPDPRDGIFTPSGIAPLLFDPDAVGQDLTADAFRDYEPQWNFMPRIAFSFPISDEAVFFAHYDVLTQRPTGQNVFNPIDYLFVQNLGNTAIANPNLLPTTTIDYELGFQQVLSRSSSLKISAFYRETRDEIQARRLLGAYPVTFTTFDNFDFGTTKGMTMTYDLRRTGNVTLRAAYTLQFASATGSSAGSALNLVNSGEPNIRVIFPTDRDQRHVFITTFDYRYGSGKDYNGPVIGGSQIFANAGLNVVGNLGSGTPYSRQRLATGAAFINPSGSPQLEGTVNGSRTPWQFRVNVQIDKSWALELGKGDNKKSAMLNAYLLINNIFDTQNILGVYRYTGNPDDDGYLAAPQFQPNIRTQLDETSFRQMYALKVANPFNYSAPRTIQLGIRLDF